MRDSLEHPVGLGDDRCFDSAEETSLINCQFGAEFCSTEMLVDWYARGQQIVTIRRGCSTEAHDDICQSAQSDRIKVYIHWTRYSV